MNPENQELASICTVVFSVKCNMTDPINDPQLVWESARSLEFHLFAERLLRNMSVSPPAVFIGLRFAKRYMSRYTGFCPANKEKAIFTAALRLADKFINDAPSQRWASISGIDAHMLMTLERRLLKHLHHRLRISGSVYFRWRAECLALFLRFRDSVLSDAFSQLNPLFSLVQSCGVCDLLLNSDIQPDTLSSFPHMDLPRDTPLFPPLTGISNATDTWTPSLPYSATDDFAMNPIDEGNACFSTPGYGLGMPRRALDDTQSASSKCPISHRRDTGMLLTAPFPAIAEDNNSVCAPSGYEALLSPSSSLDPQKQTSLYSAFLGMALLNPFSISLQMSQDQAYDNSLYSTNQGVWDNMAAQALHEHLVADPGYMDEANTLSRQVYATQEDSVLSALSMDTSSVNIRSPSFELGLDTALLSDTDMVTPANSLEDLPPCAPIQWYAGLTPSALPDPSTTALDVPTTPCHLTPWPTQLDCDTAMADFDTWSSLGGHVVDNNIALLPFGI